MFLILLYFNFQDDLLDYEDDQDMEDGEIQEELSESNVREKPKGNMGMLSNEGRRFVFLQNLPHRTVQRIQRGRREWRAPSGGLVSKGEKPGVLGERQKKVIWLVSVAMENSSGVPVPKGLVNLGGKDIPSQTNNEGVKGVSDDNLALVCNIAGVSDGKSVSGFKDAPLSESSGAKEGTLFSGSIKSKKLPFMVVSMPFGVHLTQAMKDKICNGEFVDVFQLLHREIQAKEGLKEEEWELARRPKVTTSTENWMSAFFIIASVYCERHP
ncbi:hypothetical protein NDU88_001627 [Pleurodeles waltl]|uniref:Uncharacterized protein n=1 Tax=Pleurodeles waltl TaxID=8319 RepID=A0AAV7KTB9_PLEWA|nr:hypothetical protein NDU88_001627 [Pleurodeles waltl]